MTHNISGFGTTFLLIAPPLFPVGFPLTQFSDNTDPIDINELTIGSATMGLNGDLIFSEAANPIATTMSLIPNSIDDEAMQVLFTAGTPTRGRKTPRTAGKMTLVGTYPDGSTKSLFGGCLISYKPGGSIASGSPQSLKTNTYTFNWTGYLPTPALR